jgi:plastocyanin
MVHWNSDKIALPWRVTSFMTIFVLFSAIINVAIPVNGQYFGGGQVFVSITSGSSSKTTNAYSPNPVAVNIGDTITWTNNDSTTHTVTSGTGPDDPNSGQDFDSSPNFNPIMPPGGTFSHTFTEVGEFPYYCGLHVNMVGTVIVQSGGESITLTVRTDRSSYDTDDDIVITGRLTISGGTVSQPLLLEVLDPEGDRDRIDNIEVDDDGYYSYSFNAGGLMNTDGTYTVIVSYKTTEADTTFEFDASDSTSSWRTFTIRVGDQSYPVQYTITGGTVVNMVPAIETATLTVTISSTADGTLELRLPRNVIDSRTGADGKSGNDNEFVVFIDGIPVSMSEDETSSSLRTLSIYFERGNEQIEIVGTSVLGGESGSARRSNTSLGTLDILLEISPDPPLVGRSSSFKVSFVYPGSNTLHQHHDYDFRILKGSDQIYSAAAQTGQPLIHNVEGTVSVPYTFKTDGDYTIVVYLAGTGISPTIPTDEEARFRITVAGSDPSPTPASLQISTDRTSYLFGNTAKITVQLSGQTTSGQNIAIGVTGPDGNSIVSRTLTTDGNGKASLELKIVSSFQLGTYQVISTALVDGITLKETSRFTVKSQSSGITILSIQATDQQGNPVSSFKKGSQGFVKLVVSAEASTTALITVNIFDSELTSLGVGSIKTTLGSGNSETVLSFFIPSDAATGQSEVYSNAFSDWPALGGVPLTKESSIQVRI